ncbi:hypothetical protein NRK68_36665 (plasmid) [Streptomyces yangpuensis]|uniref:Uncharacterized protein n=1 Tax=Streptomyces yangpuensis TaxID=1648182 RepID=A0ABY5Q8L7_9ACTN|nr:hypothetical protein [Streptomyces yangpuensis]UUY52791.1 hypothetical protein NRK68_36665 [Streptomyces yangpuensis]
MPEDDVKAALAAKRIAELETELDRFSAMLSNLQDVPGSSGHRYASERIEQIVAEIEALRAPTEEPTPERDGPPAHTVLLGIGFVVAAYGLTQRAWTALLIGVALMGVSQLVKPKDVDTDTKGS